VARRLEAPMRRLVTDSTRPLQAEVSQLKEKLARREANPSKFEVSLSSIPPELEQQIEQRLRKDLNPRVMDEARQQYANLLTSAKTTIDQRTTEGYESFLSRVKEELKTVDKRAQGISTHISQTTEEHMRRGLEDFNKKVLDGGNSLKRLSDELLEFLQQSLKEEHNARRQDLEKLRATVVSESARLNEHIEYLDVRIRKLDESARSLESGLDQRLSLLSSNTVKETRGQLESTANNIHEELTNRSTKTLGKQLDEAGENMKILQRGIISSLSDSLKVQSTNALQAFERSMDELAKVSVERWRVRLAGSFSALAKHIGEQFLSGAEASEAGKKH